MVKKMKFPSVIFKKPKGKMSWKWLAFKHLKAVSVISKANTSKNAAANPVFSDTAKFITALDCSWSQSKFSLPSNSGDMLEMAVMALRSNRLFFEPGNTNSILDAAKFRLEDGVALAVEDAANRLRFPFEDCVALALETEDPYVDFRVSMEEIVEAYEIKDSEHLEELLAWYLRMNKKKNHGFIVGAFIDMFTSITLCSSSCFVSG
ncbi:hypothetical protein SLEP1_g7333 [Rubroshorea leprosula]|uniref:Transcription repressor n=1 Tax=Rubroshorea leprosula TaxID=152421 RepID=A0AAV5I3U2_9ROSI|nr:hypothetical protein SLEP1_g7333 [Rubroshorea leprosula]